MRRTGVIFLLLVLSASFLQAQQPQTINEPAFGVTFTVPDGWLYQKNEMGYVFGSNTIPGIMFLSTLPYNSLDEIRQAAYEGIQDEGVMLNIVGEPAAFGKDGLSAIYEGVMNYEPAKAYTIARVHAYGGKTINGMIVTLTSAFSEAHKSSLEQLMRSINFAKPEKPAVVKQYEDYFKRPGGCRLKYMRVTPSSSYSGYSGSSAEATIDLCPSGPFSYYSSSETVVSVDAGSAASSNNDSGNGTWSLDYNGTRPVLVLKFNDGRAWEYTIAESNGNFYLNDTRYFVLFGSDGPGCN